MSNKNQKRQLKRKFISLDDKVQILNRLKDGERISSIAKSFKLNESTIRTFKRNEEKIRKTMADGCPLGAKRMTRNRDTDIIKMERDLIIWLKGCIDKNIPVNGNLIRQVALKIYNRLRKIGDTSAEEKQHSTFSASKGWLENLKKRYSLYSIKSQGEQTAYNFKDSPDIVEAYKESITLRRCRNLNTRRRKNINKTQYDISSSNISWMKQNIFQDDLYNYLEMIQKDNDISSNDVKKDNTVSSLTNKKLEDKNHEDEEETSDEEKVTKLLDTSVSNELVEENSVVEKVTVLIDTSVSNELIEENSDEEKFMELMDNTSSSNALVEENSDEEKFMELMNKSTSNEFVEKDMDEKLIKNFNLSAVKKGLDLGEQLVLYFVKNDPSTVRSRKFKWELQKCLAPYRKIVLELLKKTTFVSENEDMKSEENFSKRELISPLTLKSKDDKCC